MYIYTESQVHTALSGYEYKSYMHINIVIALISHGIYHNGIHYLSMYSLNNLRIGGSIPIFRLNFLGWKHKINYCHLNKV